MNTFDGHAMKGRLGIVGLFVVLNLLVAVGDVSAGDPLRRCGLCWKEGLQVPCCKQDLCLPGFEECCVSDNEECEEGAN